MVHLLDFCEREFKLEKDDILFMRSIHSVAQRLIDDDCYQDAKRNQNSPLVIESRKVQDAVDAMDAWRRVRLQ